MESRLKIMADKKTVLSRPHIDRLGHRQWTRGRLAFITIYSIYSIQGSYS